MEPFQMELELPSQMNIPYLTPQTFGMLKLCKITLGLGLKKYCIPNN